MEIKIDTKEKFRVLVPNDSVFSDKIAQKIKEITENVCENEPKNIILNLEKVYLMEENSVEILKEMYADSFDGNYSFVICCLSPEMKKQLENWDIFDALNITPTESEAWDMVQMEEMEREMFDEE